MSFLFHLPIELYLITKDLPSKVVSTLELDPYTISYTGYKQISRDLANQIGSYLSENTILSLQERQETKEIQLCLMIQSEQYKEILDLIPTITTFRESIIKQVAFQNVHPTSKFIFDINNIEELTQTEKRLLTVNREYGEIKGKGPSYWLNEILDLIENDSYYIHKNLMYLIPWIRIMGPPLSLITNRAESLFSQLLTFGENIQSDYIIAVFNHCMGMVKTYQSRLTESLEYYDRSYELSKSLDINLQYATRNNLGIIYRDLGDLDKSEQIYRELIDEKALAIHYSNLADVLLLKEKYHEALETLENLDLDVFPINNVFLTLHQIYLGLDRIDDAKLVEKRAEKTYEKNPVDVNKTFITKMVANRHHKLGDLNFAKEKYEEIIEYFRQAKNLRGIFENYIRLIEIQVDLYGLKPDDESVKNQLYSLVNSLVQLADEQGMAQASIEALMLRGDILLEEGEYEDTREDFYIARKLADEYNYASLGNKAEGKLETVLSLLSDEEPKQESKSLFERLKSATKQLLRLNAGQQQFKEVETEVHGLLIVAPGGTSIYDYYFSDRLTSEPSLISGLISAVSTFVSEIASGKGFLKSIQHDDLSIVMEPISNHITVCITEKETFVIRDKTRQFSDKAEPVINKHQEDLNNGQITKELQENLNQIVNKIY